jgi:hypothetical protein
MGSPRHFEAPSSRRTSRYEAGVDRLAIPGAEVVVVDEQLDAARDPDSIPAVEQDLTRRRDLPAREVERFIRAAD